MILGVALKRAYVDGSKLSAVAIRAILLADVLADLLQFEPDGRYGVNASQKCSPVKLRSFTAQARWLWHSCL